MKKILLLLTVLLAAGLQAQPPVPELWGHRVHDEAHILSVTTIEQIEAELKLHEDSTTNQIAVLIIPSLNGAVLEEYTLHVAHDVWKLGQKGNDNGVLLLIAVDDRKMRIEVGYGLEGVLTDAITSRIIRNEIAPSFRDGNYDAGVLSGIHAIINAIGSEYSAEDIKAENPFDAVDMSWKERLLIGTFIFGMLGIFTIIGLFVQGCAGWFMYAFLIPFYATFPLVVLGLDGGLTALGIYIIGFPIAKIILGKTSWGQRIAKKMNSGKSGGGGWSSGSGSWSSGSSFSSGGGGFSGGGGGFGGGGSSGSW